MAMASKMKKSRTGRRSSISAKRGEEERKTGSFSRKDYLLKSSLSWVDADVLESGRMWANDPRNNNQHLVKVEPLPIKMEERKPGNLSNYLIGTSKEEICELRDLRNATQRHVQDVLVETGSKGENVNDCSHQSMYPKQQQLSQTAVGDVQSENGPKGINMNDHFICWYSCTQCSYRSQKESSLALHMQQHQREKPMKPAVNDVYLHMATQKKQKLVTNIAPEDVCHKYRAKQMNTEDNSLSRTLTRQKPVVQVESRRINMEDHFTFQYFCSHCPYSTDKQKAPRCTQVFSLQAL